MAQPRDNCLFMSPPLLCGNGGHESSGVLYCSAAVFTRHGGVLWGCEYVAGDNMKSVGCTKWRTGSLEDEIWRCCSAAVVVVSVLGGSSQIEFQHYRKYASPCSFVVI